MNAAHVTTGLIVITLLAGCQKSEPSLRSDTSTDTPADAAPTVPDCDVLTEWSLSAVETSSVTGSVDVSVSLASAGTTSMCAGPPCLVVTAYGDGTVESVIQESPSLASFSYADPALGAGDSAQLLLRWRVLCVMGTDEEERTVTANVNVCADSSAIQSISHDACP